MTTTDQDADDAATLIERTIARYRGGDVLALADAALMVEAEVSPGTYIDWLEKVADGARNGNDVCKRLAVVAVGRLRRGE